MDGLVIWAEPDSKKAIIWCQDHGHLAWLEGWPAQRFSTGFPDVGDLLDVEVGDSGGMRPVIRATMKKSGFDPLVVDRLFQTVAAGELKGELPLQMKDAQDERTADDLGHTTPE